MKTVTTKAIAKVAAVATGLAMATSMLSLAPMAHAASLTDAQVQSILSLLTSFGADASTIANVQASLTGGTPVSTGGGSVSSSCSFSRDLTVGSTGADVTCLQNALKAGGYMSANATGYFGALTKAGVVAWQTSAGVSPAAGYFGPKSRAAFGGTTTGGTTVPPVSAGTGNGLKVMLASDSPNNVSLVQGQAIGGLAKFTFANPTGSDIKVTSLGFKRIGVSNDSTISNVYLYNGAKRLTDSAGVSSSAFNFNDTTGLFTVPAGQTYTISILADIAGSTSGQQIGVQLVSVSSSGTLDSSVALPITGATQTVSAATLATVAYATSVLPSASSVIPQNDYTVWQNTVTIGTRAVTMKSFQLRNIGSIDATDIINYRLYVDGVQVGTSLAGLDAKDSTITWDLSAAPVRLETGGRVVKVVGDIVNGSGNTFQFSLRRASDAQMIDTDLNQPVLATGNGSSSTGTFSARAATSATISSGTVSVTKAASSPSSNVAVSASNVKWATFEMRAAGEDVKIDNLDVQALTTLDHGLDNGKVFLNGVQVGSTKDLTDATNVNFTFGSSFILKAGQTAIVDIYADAKTTTGASYADGDSAQIQLSYTSGAANGQGQNSLSTVDVPGSNVTGNSITISSSAVTLTKYSGYGNQTIIAGTQNARLGAFTLSAGASEGVNVNTISVTLSANESASVTDLMLKDDATGAQIGTTKVTPASGSSGNSFSVNLNIPASGTKVINIYGTVKSGSEAGPWAANVDGSGTGASTGSAVTFGDATATTATLQTITLGTAALSGAVGVSPDDTIVVAGSTHVKVGSFDFTSQYSSFTVDKVNIKIPNGAATSVTSVILSYPNASGTQTESTAVLALPSTSQVYATATFTGLSFFVPKNTTKKLDVYVSVPTIESGATSGSAISSVLDWNEGFRATDSAGTASTTIAGADLNGAGTTGKGTLYVRKSAPTISAVALDSTALTGGSNQVLGRFKVTADAAGDIGWAKLAFNINKTAAITIGATSTVKLWQGSNSIGGSFATTTAATIGAALESFPVTAAAGASNLNLVFTPTSEQTVPAGTSLTYELRGTIAGVTTSGQNVLDVSIANPQTTASTTATAAQVGTDAGTTPSFTWTDKSSISTVHSTATSDWASDYLVKNLPLTIGTRSASI